MRSIRNGLGLIGLVLAVSAFAAAPALTRAHPTAHSIAVATAAVENVAVVHVAALELAPVLVTAPAIDTAAALHVLVPTYSSAGEVLTNPESVVRGASHANVTDTAYLEAMHRAAKRHLRSRYLETAEHLAYARTDRARARFAFGSPFRSWNS